MILETGKFDKLLGFFNLQIFQIFQIGNFWDFKNWTFFEFSKLKILEI